MTSLGKAALGSAVAATIGFIADSALAQDLTNVQAQNRGFYIGLGLGANFEEGSRVRESGTDSTAFYNGGFVGLGSVGYAMGNGLRLEVEPGYRRNNLDTISGVLGNVGAQGHATLMTLMANAIYDIPYRVPGNMPILRDLLPHVGLGAGAAKVLYNGFPFNGLNVNGHTTVPAFQVIGGVEYALTPAVKLGLDYRYLLAHNAAFHETITGGTARVGDLNNHAILLTMRYEFGVPQRPPPQPVAAPAPVMQPPVVTAPPPPPLPRDYTIYFALDSAALSPAAQDIVRQAADNARQERISRIAVTGYTDTVGKSAYNQRLSERRAAAVRSALVADGIPSDQIATQGRGETDLAVPTSNGINEPRNRRVVIMLQGPGT